MARRLAANLALMILLALPAAKLFAQSAPPSLAQWHHTAWTGRDGAPLEIRSMAQGSDGVLWLGNNDGLFSFDGITFTRFPARRAGKRLSTGVSALVVTRTGELFIGARGAVLRLANGKLLEYTATDGVPLGNIHLLAQDSSGTMWGATSKGLLRFDGERWLPVGADHGYTGTFPMSMLVDRRGTLWVADAEGIFARNARSDQFTKRRASSGERTGWGLAQAPDGSIWGATANGIVVSLADPAGQSAPTAIPTPVQFVGAIAVDAAGGLWAPTNTGVARMPLAPPRATRRTMAPPNVDRLSRAEGLSGVYGIELFQDRDGDIWLSTDGGIDRFRQSKLTPVPLAPPFTLPVIAVRADGAVLAGSGTVGMKRVDDGVADLPGAPHGVFATHRDAAGTLWLGGASGLWREHDGAFAHQALPSFMADGVIASIATNRSGVMWVVMLRRGVFRRDGPRWRPVVGVNGAPLNGVNVVATDSAGNAWIGSSAGLLLVDSASGRHPAVARPDVDVGGVTALYARGGHLWVGGESGLRLVEGTSVRALQVEGDSIANVSGIVERANGELWLNTSTGGWRIPAAELQGAAEMRTYRTRLEHFDVRDGLEGAPIRSRQLPSLVEGDDGRLWFTTRSAIAWIDPDRITRNLRPPPVQIRTVTSNRTDVAVTDTLSLAPGTTAVQIRYTAYSLAVPERVTFRYRLDGRDRAWQDAGTQREARYEALQPGTYRFRVSAANEDGVWNAAGATFVMTIPPTLVQTKTFRILCLLAVVAALRGLYLVRLRVHARALRKRFALTLAERTRIAQNLHDTLLQDFTGITLQLQGVQRTITSRPGEAAVALSRVLDGADAALRAARHAVWDLRAPELEVHDLFTALDSAARGALEGTALDLHSALTGEPRRLDPALETTALRTAREAVVNVVRHAGATHVDLDVAFDVASLRVRIRDDGCGIANARADRASERGHWGLVGMRERVAQVGGTFEITPRTMPDGRARGTEVCIVLPYAPRCATELPRQSGTRFGAIGILRPDPRPPTSGSTRRDRRHSPQQVVDRDPSILESSSISAPLRRAPCPPPPPAPRAGGPETPDR